METRHTQGVFETEEGQIVILYRMHNVWQESHGDGIKSETFWDCIHEAYEYEGERVTLPWLNRKFGEEDFKAIREEMVNREEEMY